MSGRGATLPVMGFTDDQRQVIACAVLDDNHTVGDAIAAAAAGGFGLAPFTIRAATVDRIVAEERERRRPIGEIAEDVRRLILKLCKRELSRLEQLPQLGADDALALQRLDQLQQDARDLPTGCADSGEDEELE